MHELAIFLVGVSATYLLLNVLDRSLSRTTARATEPEPAQLRGEQ